MLEFNNFTSLIKITTLAAHAVILEGLVDVFWLRELLINNCVQPRAANGTEGQTKTLSTH